MKHQNRKYDFRDVDHGLTIPLVVGVRQAVLSISESDIHTLH